MRFKIPVYCSSCDTETRIRTSRKMTSGYYVIHRECKNKACGARFKTEETFSDFTDEDHLKRFELDGLEPSHCALIIIDQQDANALRSFRFKRNNPKAELYMLKVLHAWREHSLPIIHVRHISRDSESHFSPGCPGSNFQPDFEPLPNEHIIDKSIPDAFLNTEIESWLRKRGIEQLVICGATSDGSIEGTVRTAGNLGFTVWVPDDACYTFTKYGYDGSHIPAEYAHIIAMTNIHHGQSTVVDTSMILLALKNILRKSKKNKKHH
ncbi:isochorismatase family protein [Vreelandella alkaliphila]|uniref:Isochorismatase family protein n=1 Tax=Vreelandella alkaliphila TaxID=272774 RepID=A0A7C9JSM9_9GAMM|nr:isochorismatase family protein [Halomonas alkaliphila]NDL70620.1 isochorismatase family protein [Halomonas alkaliphila]